jgi:hypothetical protein
LQDLIVIMVVEDDQVIQALVEDSLTDAPHQARKP